MKDALGQELSEGDTVAYVARQGSSLRIDRRVIVELLPDYHVVILDGDRPGRVKPDNIVKVKLD